MSGLAAAHPPPRACPPRERAQKERGRGRTGPPAAPTDVDACRRGRGATGGSSARSAPGGAARPRPSRGPLRSRDTRRKKRARREKRGVVRRPFGARGARRASERRRGEAGACGGSFRPTVPPRGGFGPGNAARGAEPRTHRPARGVCGTGRRVPRTSEAAPSRVTRPPSDRGGKGWRGSGRPGVPGLRAGRRYALRGGGVARPPAPRPRLPLLLLAGP